MDQAAERTHKKDPKRVLFTSNYGTGKTLVMTAKAMQLGKLRRDVFALKNQTETENDAQHGISFKESSGVNLGKKGSHQNKKNKTNQDNLIDPGKTFIFLFSNPDSLLFQKLCQEFKELKDHVEVLCSKGKIIKSFKSNKLFIFLAFVQFFLLFYKCKK